MAEARLQFAAPERDAGLLYATRFPAPDPLFLLERGARKTLVVRDLEIGRAREQAAVDEVLGFQEIEPKGGSKPVLADYAASLLKRFRVRRVVVPNSFPAGLLEGLRARKVGVRVEDEPFYPERVRKQAWEVAEVTRVQRATEAALAKALALLRAARIDGRRVRRGSRTVTSEWLKEVMHGELLRRGCVAEHTIAAIGEQAVEPHNEGEGPVVPNSTIVLDVFPRSAKSHYYADCTRTVVKGKAAPKVRAMYEAVREAQDVGHSLLRAGVTGKSVHEAVAAHLKRRGFETFRTRKGWEGFTHGTGHGVGLEIHEQPGLSRAGGPLPEGSVVTVEPGLYYRGLGGVRLEDLALVTRRGSVNLTKAPRVLEV
jgi:Xaa-Pro aminopeptidase